ncbi:MAG: NAD-dependent deacylase [Anaerolineales bacterium]|nr:NAD-dependent deacylase [Anaerolineales bacterium]
MQFPILLITALRAAHSVGVLTGAGVSAESGVPTFREAQTGLWASYRAEDLATPQAFLRDPKMVWEWYAMRRARIGTVQPNPGHYALAEIECRVPAFTLITQNVDGLHRRAGSQNVIELHGNISRVKCFNDGQIVDTWDESGEIPPRCPRCGGLLRPDVVWFGEMLPEDELRKAMKAARSCNLFFAIGTSGVVQPAASLPYLALEAGAQVLEINPNPTPLTQEATFAVSGLSGEVLPALVQATWG